MPFDYDILTRSLRKLSITAVRQIAYNLTGGYQVGAVKAMWTATVDASCPFCGQPDTHSHQQLSCPALLHIRQKHPQAIAYLSACPDHGVGVGELMANRSNLTMQRVSKFMCGYTPPLFPLFSPSQDRKGYLLTPRAQRVPPLTPTMPLYGFEIRLGPKLSRRQKRYRNKPALFCLSKVKKDTVSVCRALSMKKPRDCSIHPCLSSHTYQQHVTSNYLHYRMVLLMMIYDSGSKSKPCVCGPLGAWQPTRGF